MLCSVVRLLYLYLFSCIYCYFLKEGQMSAVTAGSVVCTYAFVQATTIIDCTIIGVIN